MIAALFKNCYIGKSITRYTNATIVYDKEYTDIIDYSNASNYRDSMLALAPELFEQISHESFEVIPFDYFVSQKIKIINSRKWYPIFKTSVLPLLNLFIETLYLCLPKEYVNDLSEDPPQDIYINSPHHFDPPFVPLTKDSYLGSVHSILNFKKLYPPKLILLNSSFGSLNSTSNFVIGGVKQTSDVVIKEHAQGYYTNCCKKINNEGY